ncbi:MAG: cation diffusion facilitator family transporter [Ectothiorhodospiraceae bacterium]|nr:cation diffusion facilitator family transporter [Ectothiorhodospiraceae bacterium]
MKVERRALLLSAIMSLIVGSAGISFALLTESRAILLDGLFNLTYFIVALATVRVARLSMRPDTEEFPFGYAYFESLINAGKGLLILGVSAVALVDSVIALATGGREILAGLAIAYAFFATIACTATALRLRRAYREHPTPLIQADVENWLINSLVSGSVLLAFCLIPLARLVGWDAITPYVDPLLVTLVVVICLGMPVRLAWRAVMELLDRAPPAQVTQPVREAIDRSLASLPLKRVYVRMVRPGRTLFVTVHLVLPADFPVQTLTTLDTIRARLDSAVRQVHPRVVTDVLFTAEERWAAPTNGALEKH